MTMVPIFQLSMRYYLCTLIIPLMGVTSISHLPVVALPPPEDIPDEILRTEIIFEARSPIDGKPLTAVEYKELLNKLQGDYTEELLNCPPTVDSEQPPTNPPPERGFCNIKHVVFQIRILKLFRTLGIPIR